MRGAMGNVLWPVRATKCAALTKIGYAVEIAFNCVINLTGVIVAFDRILLKTEWKEGDMAFAGIGCSAEIVFVCVNCVAIIVVGAGTGEWHRRNWMCPIFIGRLCSGRVMSLNVISVTVFFF